MLTKIKKLPKSQLEILFEIPAEEFQKFIDKAIFELGKDIEIEGFRKGKVPKEILGKEIPKGKILNKAIEIAVRENYLKAIFESKIEPISKPEIEILPSKDGLVFKATFSVLPEVILPDYKKIASNIKRKEILIEEKEILETLNWLQKSRAKFIFENRPAKKGDFVEIEYQSPQIENNLKIKDNFILGQGHFVSGFEENLEGMNPGQEKFFSLRFPDDYFQKNLAGNLVDFKVKMVSVQKMELPEINDDFAKSLGRFENLENLKKSIAEGIKMEKENYESQRIRGEILEKIAKETKVEIPEILIETEKKKMLENLKNLVSERLKIEFKDYLEKIKKNEKELSDSFSVEAENKIKYALILREISKREKIEVSEKEIKFSINEFLKNYPIEKLKELDLDQLKSYYEEAIRNEKVLKMLENLVPKL
jgi:trigger factor